MDPAQMGWNWIQINQDLYLQTAYTSGSLPASKPPARRLTLHNTNMKRFGKWRRWNLYFETTLGTHDNLQNLLKLTLVMGNSQCANTFNMPLNNALHCRHTVSIFNHKFAQNWIINRWPKRVKFLLLHGVNVLCFDFGTLISVPKIILST